MPLCLKFVSLGVETMSNAMGCLISLDFLGDWDSHN